MPRVEVLPYDPAWPAIFARLHSAVWPAVQHAALRMEHVGSTAVPGLEAKPVIDACIVVASPRDVPHVIKGLARLGYVHRGNLGVPDREAFARPPGVPRHHLYVSPRDSLSLRNQLGLRDYLRANPDVARAYGELKTSLARRFPDDIDSYIAGKTDFILAILRKLGFKPHELFDVAAINQLEALKRPPFPAFTPQLQLETLFVLDGAGRIRSTREPHPAPGPAFFLVRDTRRCAFAVNASVADGVARELLALARDEPPAATLDAPPLHADAYAAVVGSRGQGGLVFTFPESSDAAGDVTVVTELSELEHHFRGWTADEIPERSPIVAIAVDGHPVSVCFCARRSGVAAEAGVETAPEFRGRGLAARVTSAWARMVRASGRLPIYSAAWTNAASLSVARKLGLSPYATDWSV